MKKIQFYMIYWGTYSTIKRTLADARKESKEYKQDDSFEAVYVDGKEEK